MNINANYVLLTLFLFKFHCSVDLFPNYELEMLTVRIIPYRRKNRTRLSYKFLSSFLVSIILNIS